MPGRSEMFAVTAPRSIELNKVLSCCNVIIKRLLRELIQRQLLNSRQLTRFCIFLLATRQLTLRNVNLKLVQLLAIKHNKVYQFLS